MDRIIPIKNRVRRKIIWERWKARHDVGKPNFKHISHEEYTNYKLYGENIPGSSHLRPMKFSETTNTFLEEE